MIYVSFAVSEEAVMEVKQQAMAQFQKAFMAAETRAAVADAVRYETLKINTDHRRFARSQPAHASPNDLTPHVITSPHCFYFST